MKRGDAVDGVRVQWCSSFESELYVEKLVGMDGEVSGGFEFVGTGSEGRSLLKEDVDARGSGIFIIVWCLTEGVVKRSEAASVQAVKWGS